MNCSLPGFSVHGDSPSKNTGVGCHALLQEIFPTQGSNPVILHCWILYCQRHQGSPRIEWVAYPFSRGYSQTRNWIGVSCIAGRFFTSRATREAPHMCISSVVKSGRTLLLLGPQHTRLPCLSPTPRAYSNSRPLSRWCHLTISSSVIPFSSCLQSFWESSAFLMSQFFTSGGQSIGVSASAPVLLMNIQD